MRTKTLLLAAALAAAGLITATAQTVYSVNAVGFVNVSVPAGAFALLANPLNQPTNDLVTVLADAPDGTTAYEFTPAGFQIYTKRSATLWTGTGAAAARLDPGKGFFVKNNGAAAFNLTFIGEVPQGTLSTPIATGFNLLGSKVPQAGTVETQLGLPAAPNDQVYVYGATGYTITTRRSPVWTGGTGEPVIGVAQGFFLNRAAANGAATWTRTFSVNQ
jgi:hypothetical protein